MTDKKTRVILIRHGESNVTVQRILGGEKSCTGLSELGQQQAAALRDRFVKEQAKVDYLYASTMPRAMETAEIIQPALNLDKLHLDSELVEHRPGEADGKPYEELQTLFRRKRLSRKASQRVRSRRRKPLAVPLPCLLSTRKSDRTTRWANNNDCLPWRSY